VVRMEMKLFFKCPNSSIAILFEGTYKWALPAFAFCSFACLKTEIKREKGNFRRCIWEAAFCTISSYVCFEPGWIFSIKASVIPSFSSRPCSVFKIYHLILPHHSR
jgi:hypothetical protein